MTDQNPKLFGVWLPGVGWLKTHAGAVAFVYKDVADSVADRIGQKARAEFIDDSIKDLEQVLLAAEYFGYMVWYEFTSDDYDSYYKERGRRGYLGIFPKSMIDPTKRENTDRHRGTPITPFSLTKQLDNGISFFEHHCDKIDWIEILDNALLFDPYDRTKFDILVTFLILVSCLMERPIIIPPKKRPLVTVYGVNNEPVFDGNTFG